MKYLVLLPLAILGISTLAAPGKMPADRPKACARFESAVATGTPAQKLKKFIDTQWTYFMTTYPEWATEVGYPGQDDRWTDMSLAAIAEGKLVGHCQLKALEKIPRGGLKGEDIVNFDLLKSRLDLDIEGEKFDDDYLVLNHLDGIHLWLPDMMDSAPKATKKNYEDRLKRLRTFSTIEEQTETLLREGLKRKVTPVKMFLEQVPSQFDRVLTAKVEDSPIYKPFTEIQAPMSAAEKLDLQKRAQDVILTVVYPALKKLRTYLVTEYIPNARTAIAWKDLPNGEAWYAYSVKRRTTTNRTPEELHQLGLSEVARLTTELDKIRQEVKFKGDLKAFNHFLLTDKQFFFTNKDDLLNAHRDIAKRLDPELVRLFKTLPRLPYGVREMPAYKAKESPAAYYEGGSLESGRPAYFTANTYDLPSRPKWGIETLTMHEAVPGHHLQIALAQEMKDLPEFRRHENYTAFVEGWALYAESLGGEMGFYKDPYSHYGNLNGEMLRACRLVLDTGLHSKGWTRDQAVKYFTDHTAMTQHEAEVEVDRYLTWPGQALAYKVGQLKIRELRNLATAELGEKFDVRLFHDEVLKHGALPLDVLEHSVKDWITAQKKLPAGAATKAL